MLQFWGNVEIADREYPRPYSGRSAQIIGYVEMPAGEYPRDIRRGEQN